MSNTITRNDVKQLAEKIEVLAKDVQSKLDNNGDVLTVANELVRNNVTFVFALGELFAVQQLNAVLAGTNKKVKATPVNSANWHNVRDSKGRFTKKV